MIIALIILVKLKKKIIMAIERKSLKSLVVLFFLISLVGLTKSDKIPVPIEDLNPTPFKVSTD